jgi:TRAP-type C4-dicarboxylate transport system permease small subunit
LLKKFTWYFEKNPLRKSKSIIFDSLLNVLAAVAAFLIGAATICVCIEVVARYFLNNPQDWTLETTEYILLWITFMSAAWVLKREGHVSIDMLPNKLNPRSQSLLTTFTSVISAIACIVIFWYSLKVTYIYYQQGFILPKSLEIPKFPIFSIISLGCLMLSIQFLRRAYKYLLKWKELRDNKVT